MSLSPLLSNGLRYLTEKTLFCRSFTVKILLTVQMRFVGGAKLKSLSRSSLPRLGTFVPMKSLAYIQKIFLFLDNASFLFGADILSIVVFVFPGSPSHSLPTKAAVGLMWWTSMIAFLVVHSRCCFPFPVWCAIFVSRSCCSLSVICPMKTNHLLLAANFCLCLQFQSGTIPS